MRLDPERIASESHTLVPTSARHALGLLDGVENFLMASGIQDLSWREGILRTWHVLPRPGVRCIFIRHHELREWTICISAHREGAYLAVAWYLIGQPSLRGDLRRLLRLRSSQRERETIGSELTARRRAQLGLLSALTRQAVQRAIDDIADAANSRSPSRLRAATRTT